MGLCFSSIKKPSKKQTQGQPLSSTPSSNSNTSSSNSSNRQGKARAANDEEARRLRFEAAEKRLNEKKYRGTQNGGGALLAKLEKQNQKSTKSNQDNLNSGAGGLNWVVDG